MKKRLRRCNRRWWRKGGGGGGGKFVPGETDQRIFNSIREHWENAKPKTLGDALETLDAATGAVKNAAGKHYDMKLDDGGKCVCKVHQQAADADYDPCGQWWGYDSVCSNW